MTRWSRSGRIVSPTEAGTDGRRGPNSRTVTGTADATLTVKLRTPSFHAAAGTEKVPFVARCRAPDADAFTHDRTLDPFVLSVTVSSHPTAKVATRLPPGPSACHTNEIDVPTTPSLGTGPTSPTEVAEAGSTRRSPRNEAEVEVGDGSRGWAVGPASRVGVARAAARRASATNVRRRTLGASNADSSRTTVTRPPLPTPGSGRTSRAARDNGIVVRPEGGTCALLGGAASRPRGSRHGHRDHSSAPRVAPRRAAAARVLLAFHRVRGGRGPSPQGLGTSRGTLGPLGRAEGKAMARAGVGGGRTGRALRGAGALLPGPPGRRVLPARPQGTDLGRYRPSVPRASDPARRPRLRGAHPRDPRTAALGAGRELDEGTPAREHRRVPRGGRGRGPARADPEGDPVARPPRAPLDRAEHGEESFAPRPRRLRGGRDAPLGRSRLPSPRDRRRKSRPAPRGRSMDGRERAPARSRADRRVHRGRPRDPGGARGVPRAPSFGARGEGPGVGRAVLSRLGQLRHALPVAEARRRPCGGRVGMSRPSRPDRATRSRAGRSRPSGGWPPARRARSP